MLWFSKLSSIWIAVAATAAATAAVAQLAAWCVRVFSFQIFPQRSLAILAVRTQLLSFSIGEINTHTNEKNKNHREIRVA